LFLPLTNIFQAMSSKKEKENKGESWLLNKLSIVTDNLETYQGRDTVISLLHYLALIMADLCVVFKWGKKKKLGENFVNMFVQLSNCRVMLRLFDDFSAIREYYRFNKEQNEKVLILTRNKKQIENQNFLFYLTIFENDFLFFSNI